MQSVLITGASSGFGANVALALLDAGWRVVASMRDLTKGQWLVDAAEATGAADRLFLIELDVTDAKSVDAGVERALGYTEGVIDALFANAGYSALGAFEDMGDTECRHQMDTNFFGVLAVARLIVPRMREAGHGRIVIVSSNAVNTPHPLFSVYAASKWALEGWAEALAMELAPFGVDVRVVQPGAHRTPFAQHVVPIVPEGSPYRQWIDMTMPGAADLDQWGKDPEAATAPIVRAIVDPDAPFHTRIGEDSMAFHALKGMVPFEVRAWLARSIVGFPPPNAFGGNTAPSAEHPVLANVIRRVAAHATDQSSEAAALAAKMIVLAGAD